MNAQPRDRSDLNSRKLTELSQFYYSYSTDQLVKLGAYCTFLPEPAAGHCGWTNLTSNAKSNESYAFWLPGRLDDPENSNRRDFFLWAKYPNKGHSFGIKAVMRSATLFDPIPYYHSNPASLYNKTCYVSHGLIS